MAAGFPNYNNVLFCMGALSRPGRTTHDAAARYGCIPSSTGFLLTVTDASIIDVCFKWNRYTLFALVRFPYDVKLVILCFGVFFSEPSRPLVGATLQFIRRV